MCFGVRPVVKRCCIISKRPDSSPAVEANLDRCRGTSCASMHVLCSQLLSRDCDDSPCFIFNLSIFDLQNADADVELHRLHVRALQLKSR